MASKAEFFMLMLVSNLMVVQTSTSSLITNEKIVIYQIA